MATFGLRNLPSTELRKSHLPGLSPSSVQESLLALGSAQFITILRKPPLLWLNAAFLGWLGGGVAARDPFWAGTAMPLDLLGDFAPPVGAVVALLLAYIALRGRNIQKVPEE